MKNRTPTRRRPVYTSNAFPRQPTTNVFCPTGEGGGIDPTCKKGETRGESRQAPAHAVQQAIEKDTRAQDIHAKVLAAGEHEAAPRTPEGSWDKVSRSLLTYEKALRDGIRGPELKALRDVYLELKHEATAPQRASHAQVMKLLAPPRPGQLEYTMAQGREAPYPEAKFYVEKAAGWLSKVLDGSHMCRPIVENASDGRSACQENLKDRTSPFVLIAPYPPGTHTVVHELGHALEDSIPGARRACEEFLAYRTEGEEPTNLRAKYGTEYGPNEFGLKDRFEAMMGGDERRAYYVGRHYRGNGTEIFSMGLEALHRDPVAFAKADPEYFKLIVGLLHGTHGR